MRRPSPLCSASVLRRVSVLLLAGAFLAPAGLAQEVGRVEQVEANTPPFFYFLRPGEATTQVYVWGSIPNAGLYEIGTSIDLSQLLTLAGGPLVGTRDERVREKTTIRVFRTGQGERELIYEALVEDLVRAPDQTPTLRDGDVVTVETVVFEPGFSWRDALSLTTAILALTLTIDRLLSN